MNPSNPGNHNFQLQQVVQKPLYAFQANADFQHIDFQLVNDLVEPLTVMGNEDSLVDIISILMSAAGRFVGASKLVVSVKQLLHTDKDVLLEFEVSDNGPSLTSKTRAHLFSYKRCLAKARELVARQGGKSVINSLYGVGTNFKFLLKYAKVKKADAVQANISIMGSLAGKKVLVAEDNELNQKVISHLLKREGMLVDIACDGREAVELFEQNQGYDLMLLDLQLPLMDGFQSAVYIRRKLKSNVPIIALTAGFHSNAQARCLEIGIDRYIKKPLQPAELLNNLNYLLVKKAG